MSKDIMIIVEDFACENLSDYEYEIEYQGLVWIDKISYLTIRFGNKLPYQIYNTALNLNTRLY